jgi:RHS repeat-associated protein
MKRIERALVGLLGALALQSAQPLHAQTTLPAPPVSPRPVVDYEYDAMGRGTKATQAKGVAGFGLATSNAYDGLGRLKSSTDPAAARTEFGYDALDRLFSVTDPRSLVTQYPRNGLGDLRQLVSPDTGTASHTYDVAGNLATRTDSRGVLSTYSYDALNRLKSVVHSKSGSTSQSYGWTYDQTGAGFSYGIGRLTSSTHPAGSAQHAYDPFGRLLTDIQRVNPAAGANAATVTTTVSYAYDTAGRITSITYPSGRKLSLSYTGGALNSISLAPSETGTAIPLITRIQWEPFGAASSWRWQLATGGQLHSRVFDTSGRLVRYPLGPTVRDITYDAADRMTKYTHYTATGTAQPALDQAFGYDAAGRLTSITAAGASWTIGYDASGNRTGVTLNGSASTYTTAATSNRLASTTNPARSFSYDEAGNTTASTAVNPYTATYDLAGRMATLTKSGVTTTYSIDGSGRRVRKFSSTGAASTVIFVYDQAGQILGEYDSTGKAIREYVWMGSTPIAVFTPDQATPTGNPIVYTIHTDHLDTPRVVLDKNGAIRWRWLAEPFGTTAPETNPSNLGAFTLNLRFPGQYADQESGLFYNYFRNLDPTIGRYVESDPIGLAGGSYSTFTYADSNPLVFTDPRGLETCVLVVKGNITGIGNHAGLYMSRVKVNETSSTTEQAIYDPSGSWGRDVNDGEELVLGKRASIDKYRKWQKRNDKSDTEAICKQTSAEEEQRLFEKVLMEGNKSGPVCAKTISNILQGSPYFPGVQGGTFFPGNLGRDARR